MPNKKTKKNKSVKKTHNRRNKVIIRKYKELLNNALLIMHGYSQGELTYEEFTDQDYSFITGLLQQGIKEGWKYLSQKQGVIDLKCHMLCCSVAIINYQLSFKKSFDQLTDLEKLYLFFIYYFNPRSNLKKELSHEASVKKIDELIQLQLDKYKELRKLKGENNKSTKRYKKNYKRQLTKKVNMIKEKSTIDAYVCSSLDCNDILKTKKDTLNHKLSIDKFCKEVPVIFKGLVIKLMEVYKKKHLSKIPSDAILKNMNKVALYNLCNELDPKSNGNDYSWADIIIDDDTLSNEQKKQMFIGYIDINKELEQEGFMPQNNRYMLELNLSEFIDKHRSDVIFIPTIHHYKEKDYYKEGEYKPVLKTNNDLWVFTNYNMKKKTIDKIPASKLQKNKYYITVVLDGGDNDFYIEGQEPAYGRKLLDFIDGSRTPSIYSLDKEFKKKRKEFNCQELIMNSISMHWVLSTKQDVPNIIKKWGLVDYDHHFDKDQLVNEIKL